MDIDKQNIMYLPGVGPKKAETLMKEIQVSSWEDMLYYFPYKYIDRSKIFKIREIDGNMPFIQLKGKIRGFELLGEGSGRRLTATFFDDTGTIELVWFRMLKQIPEMYKPGVEYILFGKPTLFGHRFSVAHPELETENKFYEGEVGIQGQYNTTERMKNAFLHSRALQKIIVRILENVPPPLPETLSRGVIDAVRVISLDEAIRNIHFPKSAELLRKAQYRLKFEELFYLQLHILQITKYREKRLG
ncbi:MAG: ATP-dependent DNA helicase RecG, partial [Dysgonamonadaceae bacterium]|nr:ATP-dependent DNA helicase RecG [Dysgonamonadaceae bacterium]